ncbi:hypothetical protein NDU88_001510 [Pleurodeles waltl]|uniref:Uncharacterized protein n=1 Tax=Pleurodeles waltl TaxID=8319 RepID=A0AAV7U727_PLEWA|nr:hypothetical protein NDU88_001510 [Pleurodeles waltl]
MRGIGGGGERQGFWRWVQSRRGQVQMGLLWRTSSATAQWAPFSREAGRGGSSGGSAAREREEGGMAAGSAAAGEREKGESEVREREDGVREKRGRVNAKQKEH